LLPSGFDHHRPSISSAVAVNSTGGGLASYLGRHAATFDRVVTEISKSPEPWWKSDAPSYSADPIPGLVGHVQLITLEVAQALQDGRQGKHAIAWERLHAMARLSDGIGRRRELISQLISLVEARHICRAMRKMEAPGVTAWRVNGYRREVARSFAIESSLVATLVHGFPKDVWNYTLPEDQRQPSVIRYSVFFVLAPYFRASVVNLLQAERSSVSVASQHGLQWSQHSRTRGAPGVERLWKARDQGFGLRTRLATGGRIRERALRVQAHPGGEATAIRGRALADGEAGGSDKLQAERLDLCGAR
jgi:hypothetical protein